MIANRTVKAVLKLANDMDLLDVQVLLAFVLKTTRAGLYAQDERVLTDEEWANWNALMQARREGMPVAYLVGEKECYGMMFEVTPDVLIPRPDTELIIECVLKAMSGNKGTLLDLATGPGVIACALGKRLPDWHIVASDISEKALEVAKRNIARHALNNIETRLSDVFEAIDETFDMIVSNPPYLGEDDLHLAGDIRFEPQGALIAPEMGYGLLRRVIEGGMTHLNANGMMFLEHGFEQGSGVRRLFEQNKFQGITTVRDLSGHERVTYARKGEYVDTDII